MKQFFTKVTFFLLGMAAMFSFVGCGDNSQVSDEEIATLQSRLDSICNRYDVLKIESEKYGGSLSAKDSVIEAQKAEINSLIAQLRRAKSANVSNGDAAALREKEAQLAKLRKQVDSQAKELKRLEAEANSSKANGDASAALNDQVNQLKSTVADQERQIAKLNGEISSLNRQVENQNGTIKSLSAERDELSRQAADLKKEVASLGTQVSAVAGNEQAGAKELAQCRQQVAQAQGEADELRTQVANLQSQLAQMEVKDGSDAQQAAALNKQVGDLQNQVSQLQKQIDAKDKQLSAVESARSADQKSAADAAAEIAQLKKQVADQRGEIDRLTAEAANAKSAAAANNTTTIKNTANQKLSDLQKLCDSYAQEIERLRAENAQLKNENSQLRDEMSNIQKDAEKALTDNSKLAQKVALASILVADDLQVTPAKAISGVTIKPTEKASQVMGLRIEGRLLDNNVVDPGTVTIYARVSTSNNRIVANGTPEEFDLSGVTMQYTTRQDIEFSGASRKIMMLWKKYPNVEMAAGLYWVTLYANGNEIGKTSFVLK